MVVLTYTDEDEFVTRLELPNPLVGNTHQIQVERALKRLRHNRDIVTRDPDWATDRIQQMTFKNLTEITVTALKTFLRLSIGQGIVLLDWLGDTYNATILNPGTTFVTDLTYQASDPNPETEYLGTGRGKLQSVELVFAGIRV